MTIEERIICEIAECRSYIDTIERAGLGKSLAPPYRERLAMLEKELKKREPYWREWDDGCFVLYTNGKHVATCAKHYRGDGWSWFWKGKRMGGGTLEECKASAEEKARERWV